jgi:hypothetical protein
MPEKDLMAAKLTAGGHFLFTESEVLSELAMLKWNRKSDQLKLGRTGPAANTWDLGFSRLAKALGNEAEARSWSGNQKLHNRG